MRIFIAVLLSAFVLCCAKDSPPEIQVTFERFDEQLMAVKTKEELVKLLEKNRAITELFYGGNVSDTAFVSDVFHMIKHEDAQKLFKQSQDTFGDLTKVSTDFAKAFDEVKKLYPDYTPPKMVAAFTGLRNDMFITDSLVIVSLEAFIGPNALYRPDQSDYMMNRFTPEYIVPSVVRVLSNKFNKVNFEKDTFTADMIFFGKSLEFSRAVLPHIADSLIIGYTNTQMQNAYENQDVIWAHVIERELLNSDNPTVNAKYFGERPYMAEISKDCPGRIGQWLGWRIVELYRANNPKVSIQDLMKNENVEEILRGSKYRGQKDE